MTSARLLGQRLLSRLLRHSQQRNSASTPDLSALTITFLAVKSKGRVGRRSCLACRQRVSGPARHVCAGNGRGRPGGSPGRKIRLRVAERDGWICQLCGDAVDARLPARHPLSATIDHRTPRGVGGSRSSVANMQLAHQLCNGLRATVPLESLDLTSLRADFARAWERYLQVHPQGTPEAVIARCEQERERRLLLRIRRREQRRLEHCGVAVGPELPGQPLAPLETHTTGVLDGYAPTATPTYV